MESHPVGSRTGASRVLVEMKQVATWMRLSWMSEHDDVEMWKRQVHKAEWSFSKSFSLSVQCSCVRVMIADVSVEAWKMEVIWTRTLKIWAGMKADEWIRISLTELTSLMICTLKTLKPRRLLWHISKLINLKSESEFENLINPKENDVCFI